MYVNKKILSIAIFGALVSGNAFAANLSATGGAIPSYFAREIIATPAAPVTLGTSAAGATLNWDIGYNFSTNEVRYARLECSTNIEFAAGTTVTSADAGASVNFGSTNGLGSNVLTFSVTSTGTDGNITEDDTFVVSGNHAITGTDSDVTCAVALYDQPSQAQVGGTIGRIQNTFFNGTYLSFVQSYALTATNNTAIADVEAVPSFTSFLADGSTTAATADLSTWAFGLRDPDGTTGPQTATFNIAGSPITLAQLFAATTSISVSGDFTPAANAAAPLYMGAALGRVTAAGAAADELSATTATFEIGANPVAGDFLLTRRAGTTIQAAEYLATLNAVSAAPTVYAVSNLGPAASGVIVRNGTELQAPLAQVPPGWLSRMVLTNTGNTVRGYTVRVIGENGNTIGTANLTGTVPANGTTVVDVGSMLTSFTAAPRATLVVSVAGPSNQIQGLYQIVNPEQGSISNHAMIRPGTN